MIYLIHYNRPTAKVIRFEEYLDSDKQKAQRDRLGLELQFNAGDASQEIILLEAKNREQLKHTHAKYFENGLQDAIAALG